MKNISYKKQKILVIVSFLFFPMLFLLVLTYYPALKLIQISFSNWNGYSPKINYIGWANYTSVFQDGSAFLYLKNNLAYVIMMLIQTGLAVYFAIILSTQLKGKNFFKSTIFMPYIMNGIAIAFMFDFMYSYQQGALNEVLRKLGLPAIHWLNNNYSVNFALAFIVLWRYLGFSMVIVLGALQSISPSLYESSNLDGANFFHNIRYITLPSIKPVIVLLLFLGVNGSLQIFFEPYVITRGGPAGMSNTFSKVTYDYAFEFQKMGMAAALGVILLGFVVLVLLIQSVITKQRRKEGVTDE